MHSTKTAEEHNRHCQVSTQQAGAQVSCVLAFEHIRSLQELVFDIELQMVRPLRRTLQGYPQNKHGGTNQSKSSTEQRGSALTSQGLQPTG
jgi:hypothetical protein